MRIATMATGGIGGALAVRLTLAGHEVACIARGAHLHAIRRDGLRLRGADGEAKAHPWAATDEPASIGPVDAVVFAVKAAGLDAAAQAARPLLGPGTPVVPFLNGVEAADRLAAILPPAAVAEGVAYISASIAAPGVVAQTGGFQRFAFAERDNRPSARLSALRTALVEAGFEAPEPADIAAELWRKFVFFTALSGVTAAARCTIGAVRAQPELAATFRAAMAETEALARARGIALPADTAERHWQMVEGAPENMRASTAVDLARGAALETPWINGAVVRLAAEAGLDAPINRTLAAVLAPHLDGAAAQS